MDDGQSRQINPYPIPTTRKFNSFDEAKNYIKNYANFEKEVYTLYRSKTIEKAEIKHWHRPEFTLYYGKFCCYFGPGRNSRGKGIKNSRLLI